jgi:head-tail adaptor
MRVRIPFELEEPQENPDGAGGVRMSWAKRGTLWGELRAGAGQEALTGATGVATATHEVRVRGAPVGAPSRPGVRDRFRHGDRVFRIVSVREADALGTTLECRVVEEVTA